VIGSAHHGLIDDIEQAIACGSAGRNAEALQRVTDLLVLGAAAYSDDQIALFDQVIGRLEIEIELCARVELARRLAVVPNAPPAISRKLALDDEIAVAGVVLAHSERLDVATLVECARTKGQEHLLAIAGRMALPEAVTDVVVVRGGREVLLGVVRNDGARFSGAGFATLVERAAGDDALVLSVGARSGLPRHLFLKLLAKASDNVRARLERLDPQAAAEIRSVVARVAGRIRTRSANVCRDYSTAAALVRSLQAAGTLGDGELAGFARGGRLEEVTAALALICDLPILSVEGAMVHQRAEPLIILARAAGLSWRTTKAILLLRAGGRGIGAHELEQHLTSFELLKPATAQQIVRLQRSRRSAAAD
jgi:uncharacterized protein (DUF2336 family)